MVSKQPQDNNKSLNVFSLHEIILYYILIIRLCDSSCIRFTIHSEQLQYYDLGKQMSILFIFWKNVRQGLGRKETLAQIFSHIFIDVLDYSKYEAHICRIVLTRFINSTTKNPRTQEPKDLLSHI